MKKYILPIVLGATIITAAIFYRESTVIGQATSPCKTFDMTGWTQEQKNALPSIAPRVLEYTFNFYLRVDHWSNQTGEICFFTILDMPQYLTEANYLAEFAAWQNELALALKAYNLALAVAETDLMNLENQLKITTCYNELIELRRAIRESNYPRALVNLVRCLR